MSEYKRRSGQFWIGTLVGLLIGALGVWFFLAPAIEKRVEEQSEQKTLSEPDQIDPFKVIALVLTRFDAIDADLRHGFSSLDQTLKNEHAPEPVATPTPIPLPRCTCPPAGRHRYCKKNCR